MRLLQSTEVSECPGNLISVSFYISVFFGFCSQYIRYVTGYGRFFGNTNYHIFFRFCSNRIAKVIKTSEEILFCLY